MLTIGKGTLGRLAAITLAAMLAGGIAGCSDGKDGVDGAEGQQGPQGPIGPAGPPGPAAPGPIGTPAGELTGGITAIDIDTTASAIVTVTFSINDADGLPVSGANTFRYQIAKLVPATDFRPAYWQSYVNYSRSNDAGGVLWSRPEEAAATEIEPGVYQYTFGTDLDSVADYVYYGSGDEPIDAGDVGLGSNGGLITNPAMLAEIDSRDWTYDPQATHRIVIIGRDSGAYYNASVDFVPATLPATLPTYDNFVVTNESCGACHGNPDDRGRLRNGMPHGGRYFTTQACMACHSGNTYDTDESTAEELVPLDILTVAHKTHAAHQMGFEFYEFAELTYPQEVSNCRTCHDNGRITQPAGRDEADAMAWMSNPSQQACGSCHVTVDFTDHFGNQPDNAQCVLCHGPGRSEAINVAHANQYSTPNNPELPAGVGALQYEIASVTVDEANFPTVKFRVLLDGEPLDLKALPAGMAFGGGTSPGFKLAWSGTETLPNGSVIAAPTDFNNVGGGGRSFYGFGDDPYEQYAGFSKVDQPFTVGIRDLVAGLPDMDAEGYFTATLATAFPADATLRAVAMESYFTFNLGTPDQINVAADAVVKAVAGEARRSVVDVDLCLTCHEGLGFHSNSGRRNNPDHCVMCHNPENSSSNTFDGYVEGTEGAFSLTPMAGFFEVSQKPMNLKDLVHSLHADAARETPFNFIRGTLAGGSGNGAYEFSEITYPQRLNNCDACHANPSSYRLPVDEDALWSVIAVEPGVSTTKLPPTTAACWSCHDGTIPTEHMKQNSGDFLGTETCSLCHGPGKTADVAEAHAR